jgi:hypothetical protein
MCVVFLVGVHRLVAKPAIVEAIDDLDLWYVLAASFAELLLLPKHRQRQTADPMEKRS